jgi:hypothetical protein
MAQLALAAGTACVVVGGSSITTLDREGEISKIAFYPTSLDEYLEGIVDAALTSGRLVSDAPGVLLVSSPGAFQREGETAALPPNFHRVNDDAAQRGMPYLAFRDLLESFLKDKGYAQVQAYGYNDAVPALVAIPEQPQAGSVLAALDARTSSLTYMVNGTGTGEASLWPDTKQVMTAEKGHLKPNLLWYRLNPFFEAASRISLVGANRSLERLMAGGPAEREPRHFTKILEAVLDVFERRRGDDVVRGVLAESLGLGSYQEVLDADSECGLLAMRRAGGAEESVLRLLPLAAKQGSRLAQRIQVAFAAGLGASLAHMHYAIGEMPDYPLKTFVYPHQVRPNVWGFIRSDGSTTAALSGSETAWRALRDNAHAYACAVTGNPDAEVRIMDVNHCFPDIHPDFGGFPELAAQKLAGIRSAA